MHRVLRQLVRMNLTFVIITVVLVLVMGLWRICTLIRWGYLLHVYWRSFAFCDLLHWSILLQNWLDQLFHLLKRLFLSSGLIQWTFLLLGEIHFKGCIQIFVLYLLKLFLCFGVCHVVCSIMQNATPNGWQLFSFIPCLVRSPVFTLGHLVLLILDPFLDAGSLIKFSIVL